MNKHILDIEKSKSVHNYFKDRLKIKKCYNNVFNVVSISQKTFIDGKWKVAYGYMTVFENVLCRHCFIIDENNKVIDPTIFTNTNVITDREYYTMKIFDDIDDYFAAIERDNYCPALDKYLKENVIQAQIWANEKGYILTG